MNVNFAFVRHGHGCHNAIKTLYKNNIISNTQVDNFLDMDKDPELTPLGVDASIYNGCIISNIIKNIYKIQNNNKLKIDYINVVGCSPLLRCMETAYYMTRKWKQPPTKIYVFPFLREIDENGSNKFSQFSRKIIDIEPYYAMKTIKQQKAYLKKRGILEFFDFSFVENDINLRSEPGDISRFIEWFSAEFLPLLKIPDNKLNVFITTHAGVLKDYSNTGFYNNSGILLNTSISQYKITHNKTISLNEYLPSIFFKHYSNTKYANKDYYCPSDRCGNVCPYTGNSTNKRLNLYCSNDTDSL